MVQTVCHSEQPDGQMCLSGPESESSSLCPGCLLLTGWSMGLSDWLSWVTAPVFTYLKRRPQSVRKVMAAHIEVRPQSASFEWKGKGSSHKRRNYMLKINGKLLSWISPYALFIKSVWNEDMTVPCAASGTHSGSQNMFPWARRDWGHAHVFTLCHLPAKTPAARLPDTKGMFQMHCKQEEVYLGRLGLIPKYKDSFPLVFDGSLVNTHNSVITRNREDVKDN